MLAGSSLLSPTLPNSPGALCCSSSSQSCSLRVQHHTHGKVMSSSNRGSGAEASRPDAGPSSPAPLNMNRYANKKSAAESMLDVALLMANACWSKGRTSTSTRPSSPSSASPSVCRSQSGSCLSS